MPGSWPERVNCAPRSGGRHQQAMEQSRILPVSVGQFAGIRTKMPCDKGNVVHAERQAIPGSRTLEPFLAIFKRLGRKAVPCFPILEKSSLAGKTPGPAAITFAGSASRGIFPKTRVNGCKARFDIHFIFGELAHQPAISGFFPRSSHCNNTVSSAMSCRALIPSTSSKLRGEMPCAGLLKAKDPRR